MAKEVSGVSGTESAAGGERSHLLYGNPSALNHSGDLPWSRISHGDYTDLKCVTQGHFFVIAHKQASTDDAFWGRSLSPLDLNYAQQHFFCHKSEDLIDATFVYVDRKDTDSSQSKKKDWEQKDNHATFDELWIVYDKTPNTQ